MKKYSRYQMILNHLIQALFQRFLWKRKGFNNWNVLGLYNLSPPFSCTVMPKKDAGKDAPI